MPNDAAPPRVDAVVPSRDAEIANDASADVGEPPPDASTEGGYCPEHLYVYNGDGYHGDNCYFDNFEGKSPSNCDVAYPGASPCFRCMVERCCLQAMCGGNEVYERLEATDGRRVFAAWSEFAMAIDRQIRFHNNALAPYTYNGAIACVAHCLDTRRPEQPGLPGPALLVECMQDCAEVFIPTCSFRPEWAEAWYEINGSIRRNVESLYACLLTGPEDNATLGQPDDYPYPTYAYDSTQPQGTPYEPRFADTSCAEVCFGIAPPRQ